MLTNACSVFIGAHYGWSEGNEVTGIGIPMPALVVVFPDNFGSPAEDGVDIERGPRSPGNSAAKSAELLQ